MDSTNGDGETAAASPPPTTTPSATSAPILEPPHTTVIQDPTPSQKNSNYSRELGYSAIPVIALLAYCSYVLYQGSKDFLNYISIWSSILSLYGVIIALFQILSLKRQSDVLESAIVETKGRLTLVVNLADVTLCRKFTQEVVQYAEDGHYDASRLRLMDLRDTIVRFIEAPQLFAQPQLSSAKKLLPALNLHIQNLRLAGSGAKINVTKIETDLNEIALILSAVEQKLKFN